jgi:hypothetical protein
MIDQEKCFIIFEILSNIYLLLNRLELNDVLY